MRHKILVIGSNSFSGSDFIDLLLEDKTNTVIGVSRSPEKSGLFLPYKRHHKPNYSFFQIDLNHDLNRLFGLITRFKPDYIVNFAAQSEVAPSWQHPDHWYQTNVLSLVKLAYWLKDQSSVKKYLHISSPEVYGTCKGTVKEDAPVNPTTPYAASKAAADLFLFTLYKNFKFPWVMVRSTNVYGAHQQLFKIIPRTVIYLKLSKQIELHGGGKAVKSYIHIHDISRGERLVMFKGKIGEIYHLSPRQGIAVRDAVKMICEKMDKPFKTFTQVVDERLGQDAAYVIDSTKARRELGWKPEISFEKGIDEVISWVNDNWGKIKHLPHEYIHKE